MVLILIIVLFLVIAIGAAIVAWRENSDDT